MTAVWAKRRWWVSRRTISATGALRTMGPFRRSTGNPHRYRVQHKCCVQGCRAAGLHVCYLPVCPFTVSLSKLCHPPSPHQFFVRAPWTDSGRGACTGLARDVTPHPARARRIRVGWDPQLRPDEMCPLCTYRPVHPGSPSLPWTRTFEAASARVVTGPAEPARASKASQDKTPRNKRDGSGRQRGERAGSASTASPRRQEMPR
jgi:hypothetical protein